MNLKTLSRRSGSVRFPVVPASLLLVDDMPANLQVLHSLNELTPGRPAVLNCLTPPVDEIQPGKVSADCGAAGYEYIRTAIAAAQANQVAAVCTAPMGR